MKSTRGCRDRRTFLRYVGRAGLAAIALPPGQFFGGPGAAQSRVDVTRTCEPLLQPQEIRSENGVLSVTIAAAAGQVRLGDVVLDGSLYNGSYLPPLLRPRLGDTMRITFRNDRRDVGIEIERAPL